MLGVEFGIFLAAPVAVFAGLDRGETPDSLRRLIDCTGVQYDAEFLPSSQLRYASGVLHAAAGNHVARAWPCRVAFVIERPMTARRERSSPTRCARRGREDQRQRLGVRSRGKESSAARRSVS